MLITRADGFFRHATLFDTALQNGPPENAGIEDRARARKWKAKQAEAKPTPRARGRFERPREFIERRNSTATRQSQKLLLSSGRRERARRVNDDDNNDAGAESLDASTAFYSDVDMKIHEGGRYPGLGYREERAARVAPRAPEAPLGRDMPDTKRYRYGSRCPRAAHGFTSEASMFQHALVKFRTRGARARSSIL